MIQLLHGDCLELMKDIPDKSIDMILCDLPYGTTACAWDSVIPVNPLWEQYKRIVKRGGIIALFGSEPFSSFLRTSNIDWYKYDWIWEKPNGSGFLSANIVPLKNHENISVFYQTFSDCYDTTEMFAELKEYMQLEKKKAGLNEKKVRELLGSYMGSHYFTNGSQFCIPTAEAYLKLQSTGFFCMAFTELAEKYQSERQKAKIDNFNTYNPQFAEGKPYECKRGTEAEVFCGIKGHKSKHITKNDGKRYPKTVLKFNEETGLHPTQKPVPLLEYLIRTYTNEGDTVLDNCMGSGSTGVACVNLNRNFIGMELKREYFDISRERIDNARFNQQTGGD